MLFFVHNYMPPISKNVLNKTFVYAKKIHILFHARDKVSSGRWAVAFEWLE